MSSAIILPPATTALTGGSLIKPGDKAVFKVKSVVLTHGKALMSGGGFVLPIDSEAVNGGKRVSLTSTGALPSGLRGGSGDEMLLTVVKSLSQPS